MSSFHYAKLLKAPIFKATLTIFYEKWLSYAALILCIEAEKKAKRNVPKRQSKALSHTFSVRPFQCHYIKMDQTLKELQLPLNIKYAELIAGVLKEPFFALSVFKEHYN